MSKSFEFLGSSYASGVYFTLALIFFFVKLFVKINANYNFYDIIAIMEQNFTRPYFYTLKNGLQVIVINYPHLKSTEIVLTVKSGKIYENPKDLGITHFTEHILLRGTKKYPTKEILRTEAEKIGASLRAGTSPETTAFTIKVLDQYLEKGLGMIFEVSQKALIRSKDIALEKNIILEERKKSLDSLWRIVNYHLLPRTIFKDILLALPALGEEDTLKNINQEKIMNYYKSFYNPKNMVVGINTSLPKEKVIKLVEKYFGIIKQKKSNYLQGAFPKARVEKGIFERRDINQLQIGLGIKTFKFNHPQKYDLEILKIIVGSNLYKLLTLKLGLVYGINSNTCFYSNTGYFSITIAVDKNNALPVLNLILDVLESIKKFIKDKDFNNAKNILKSNLIFREESPSHYLREITYQKIYSNKIELTNDKIKKIDQVKKADVLKIANQLFEKKNMGFVFVGDIDSGLEKNIKLILKQ